jgi:hypothetical protein
MDVKMPILNGFETANLIHERDKLKDIPIIFISANNYGDENIYKGYQSGGIDYILKPINPDILRAKVSVFVNLREQSRLLEDQEQMFRTLNEALGVEITDRKTIEQKIEKVNKELLDEIAHLKTVNRNLNQFAFISAHKVYKPLEEIAAISKDLQNTKTNENGAVLNRLGQASQSLQQAFADLLTIARTSVGEPKFVNSDLNQLIKELLEKIGQELKSSQATIKVEPLPSLMVIPELISTLFHNLISHALDSRQEKTDLLIKIYAKSGNGNNIKQFQIFVEDNGTHLGNSSEETLKSNLNLKNGKSSSACLSLALCQKIAEMHNGSLSTSGQKHKGSTFILSLPVEQN